MKMFAAPLPSLSSKYKLLAKARATRFGAALRHVRDPIQTVFCADPLNWPPCVVPFGGDGVPAASKSGQPGCMVSLDFSKA